MTNWFQQQLENFNVLMLLFMICFVTVLSRANTVKLLKEQSQELYNELEEIKDEIRGNAKK
jgi:hypothetical protein